MNGPPTEWGPGLFALFAGLVIGFFLLRRSLRPSGVAAGPVAPSAPRREAAARFDALVAQLRDQEDNASQLEPERLARERYALELAAAGALLEIEASQTTAAVVAAAATPAAASAAEPAAVGSPALRGFLWGAGGVAALALLGVMVSRQATLRQEGGSLTGNLPGEEPAAAVPDDVARLQAAVAARPDDLEARLDLSLAHVQRRELMPVFEHTQYVLERRPRDPRALSYQALVRLAMGQAAEAESMLQTAIAEDPDSLDARLHLGLVYLQQRRLADAEASLAEAIRRHPEQREQIEGLLQQMRERATQEAVAPAPGAAAASPDPHAGVAPVAPPPAATAAGSSVGADAVAVSIRLANGVEGRGVLFVIVREAGQQAGPPIAARRVGAPAFPLRVVIGAADSMMGQPLPEKLAIEARLDRDGDVATRDGDPVARLDGVARGSADTVLELKRP